MGSPAVFTVPTSALQPPFLSNPFGPAGPLWWTVVLAQLPTETTTTAKPPAGPSVVVLPYPLPPYGGGYPPAPVPPYGSCNINCPAVWEPLCSVNGAGLMYNFANLCALNAQNCVSGSDFRFLYPGICRLKR
ncbi:uncharacterized protein LOC117645959 [Thrips palmi]|uniref:Uncharacterized protein LOC117645959 n=1 Tax=Thrips palmi TaxID=161013 RepID=A0A6P8YXS0_THRPL|nr:uncharacterized protein LOC117645959 [Thrips palmi]